MKLNNLRQLVKEELKRTLSEGTPKYTKGDTFIYMGSKHLVVSDDGFIIKAMGPSGKIVKINYGQLKDRVSENTTEADVKELPLEPGTYEISYVVAERGGGGAHADSEIETITDEDIKIDLNSLPYNFWKDLAAKIANARIYKVTKVTKQ